MIATIDFETDGIEKRPDYPPTPRGVAVKAGGRQGHYYKESPAELRARIYPYWTDPNVDLLFHNANFDVAVAVEKLALPMPHWRRIHDTMILCFLHDPYARSLSLKPSAERYLGMPPEEQADVRDWILANVPEARRAKKNWGKWITKAPLELLAPYAVGDVNRTAKLFTRLHTGSVAASYDRERRLIPGLLSNSRHGLRIASEELSRDLALYERAMTTVDKRLYKLLGGSFNVDSGEELADALERAGKASGFARTATGRRSVAKGSLIGAVTCPATLELLDYRGRLGTALSTFMRNWHEMAQSHGRIFFEWHQTRGEDKGGARTGRFSSSPNIQNIPKLMQAKAPKGLPELPRLRKYLLPEEGHVWVRKDYSQQELRLLAHFEDGEMLKMYQDNPKVDLHQEVADMMAERGYDIGRTAAKTLAFSLLYGMGVAELSNRLGMPTFEADTTRRLYLSLLPGIRLLNDGIKLKAKQGKPIHTWGGREYMNPPGAMVNGRFRTFEYKLLNYLIQGSSADVTKEALGNLFDADLPGRFLCTVHDEINWSVPKSKLKKTLAELDRIMRDVKVDVPMLSDTEVGANWGELNAV